MSFSCNWQKICSVTWGPKSTACSLVGGNMQLKGNLKEREAEVLHSLTLSKSDSVFRFVLL